MSQAPKPPNPFDPVEENKIPEKKPGQTSTTPDTIPTPDYGDVANSVKEEEPEPPSSYLGNAIEAALESFRKLNNGEPAPKVVVHIDENDENHIWTSWEKPKKK